MALDGTLAAKVKQYIGVYDSALLTDTNLDFVIEDNAASLSADFFGDKYAKAIAFLTMHDFAVASQTNASATEGVIIQKTVGPITVKYASPNEGGVKSYTSLLGSTRFGLMYLQLVKSCGSCGITVNHFGGRP